MEEEPVSAESIARLADNKQDVSSYFTNDGKIMPPIENGTVIRARAAIEELREAVRVNRGTD